MVARHAYQTLAREFDWDLDCIDFFGTRRLLYVPDVTPEGFGVWFIAHSNFTSDNDPNEQWNNTIRGDYIFEEWLSPIPTYHKYLISDASIRVVFSKKASGNYYFLGVYAVTNIEKNEKGNYVKTYERISTVYPMN